MVIVVMTQAKSGQENTPGTTAWQPPHDQRILTESEGPLDSHLRLPPME